MVVRCRHVQGQEVNAATELEKVLKVLPSDRDALLLTGKLLTHITTGIPSHQRLDLLKEGAARHDKNPAIQVHRPLALLCPP